MRWIEVTIETPDTEAMSVELEMLGVEGVIIEDYRDFQEFLERERRSWDYVDAELEERYRRLSRVRFYLPDDDSGAETLKSVREHLDSEAAAANTAPTAVNIAPTTAYTELSVAYTDDEDWENNWREYYQPIEVGERLVIVPEWLETPASGRIALRLDPGLAFGTGSHPTTQMCLAELEKYVDKGKRVLDIGCGSGILGLGALMLGCAETVGCDIDPLALKATRDNAALNGIDEDRLKLHSGDILSDGGLRSALGNGYDIVLANIVADVIIPLSRYVREFMVGGGVFICSGIIESRQDEVKIALLDAGFDIVAVRSMGEWHSIICR